MPAWVIYVLKDPRDGAVRYVGFTSGSAAERLQQHIAISISGRERTLKSKWICSLAEAGISPTVEVVEHGSGNGQGAAEQRWVAHYRANGAALVNGTDGGDGIWISRRTPEERSAIAKKRWAAVTPEKRMAIMKKASGARTPECLAATTAKMNAAQTFESRSIAMKKAAASMSREQLSARSKKANAAKIKKTPISTVRRPRTAPRGPNPGTTGERNNNAKLTENQVREIRTRWKLGECTQTQMAIEYGVTQGLISAAVLRRTWKHVI